MTDAPDPGLTDLIAAEITFALLKQGWHHGVNVTPIAAHVALVVEQHTNGRMASDLVADPQDYEIAWAAKLRWQARAEKAEATIARAWSVLPNYSAEPGGKATAEQIAWLDGTKHVQRQLRAALEGQQILDPDSPEFRAAIRSVCDEQSWIYGMSRSECEYIITQGVKAAAKPSEESL